MSKSILEVEDEIRHSFIQELGALLIKYNAEIRASDHWTGYPECGEDVRMTVTIESRYENSELIHGFIEIDLTDSIQPEDFK